LVNLIWRSQVVFRKTGDGFFFPFDVVNDVFLAGFFARLLGQESLDMARESIWVRWGHGKERK
jgi:hypothetical protein